MSEGPSTNPIAGGDGEVELGDMIPSRAPPGSGQQQQYPEDPTATDSGATGVAPPAPRAKGASKASVLGFGGGVKCSDLTVPRFISFIFFGGGEIILIPALWAVAVSGVFIFRMVMTESMSITEYMAKVLYQLAMLAHVIGNLTFGWMLCRDHALDYYLRRCAAEGTPTSDMFSRLEVCTIMALFITIVIVICHTIVFSTSSPSVMMFEFFFGVMFFSTSFFLSSIWVFIVWNKYRSARPYLITGCDAESVVQGRAWAVISDSLDDMKVVSKYWHYGNYSRLGTGVIYSGFCIFQFYVLYSGASISTYFDYSHNTQQIYAFLLLIEFMAYFGSLWIPMVLAGWVNDKLVQHIMDAIVKPLDFDYERGLRIKEARVMETYRHQLVMQVDTYKHYLGFSLGNGALKASDVAAWGITVMIIFFLFAVSGNQSALLLQSSG